jgi:hypothetical protein
MVVLPLEHLHVLSKVRRGDGAMLSRPSLFHKPVSEDELQVEDKEGRGQARSHFCVHIMHQSRFYPVILP